MKKIFIACPYVKHFTNGAFIDDAYKEFLEALYSLCSNYAEKVFLALKKEEYGKKPRKNYSCLMDFNELASSDLVIALPDDSMGVGVELGWASALQKPIILLLDKTKRYSPLTASINTITNGSTIWYKTNKMSLLPSIQTVLEQLE